MKMTIDSIDQPPEKMNDDFDSSDTSLNLLRRPSNESENTVFQWSSDNSDHQNTVIHEATQSNTKQTPPMSEGNILDTNLNNDAFKFISDGSVNDREGWKNFCLFAQRIDKRAPLNKNQMHPGNLAKLATNILKLDPEEVVSINWDRPDRPLIITRSKIPMDRICKDIALPLEVDLRDEDNHSFKVMIDCPKLMLASDRDYDLDLTLKYGYGKICEEAVRMILSPFCKVNSLHNASYSDKSDLKKFPIFNDPKYQHWNTKSSDLIINVTGNPKNIPSLIPCGDEVETLEFFGQTKQCENCFMFGHLRLMCEEKTRSIDFYKSWIVARLRKVKTKELSYFTKYYDFANNDMTPEKPVEVVDGQASKAGVTVDIREKNSKKINSYIFPNHYAPILSTTLSNRHIKRRTKKINIIG